MTTAPSQMTILACMPDKIATKRHKFDATQKVWATESYQTGHLFAWAVSDPLNSLDDVDRLMNEIEEHPRAFVIRGEPRSNLPKIVRRTSRDTPSQRAQFAQHAVGRTWLMIDIDGAPRSPGCEPSQPTSMLNEVAALVRRCLPSCFHGSDFWYQWSASAGVARAGRPAWVTLSAHLVFLLDRPGFDPALRVWLSGRPNVDVALFNPVQPHYVAAPIFDGAPSPLAVPRSGIVRVGKERVCLPAEVHSAESWSKQVESRRSARRVRSEAARARNRYFPAGTRRRIQSRYVSVVLSRALDAIEAAGEGERHTTIVREALNVMGLAEAGALDTELARRKLYDAGARVLPEDRLQELEDILDYAEKNAEPRELGHVQGFWDRKGAR